VLGVPVLLRGNYEVPRRANLIAVVLHQPISNFRCYPVGRWDVKSNFSFCVKFINVLSTRPRGACVTKLQPVFKEYTVGKT
jgi:hypothetical protein